jgi:hypothetical protein
MGDGDISMIPKIDDTIANWIGYLWVIGLASWGGIVSYLHRVNQYKLTFNFLRLFAEITTSAFVGVITFLMCDASHIELPITAALVGISGHMGTRALFLIEQKYERFAKGD